jgi:DNA-binding response OmpR family regulator
MSILIVADDRRGEKLWSPWFRSDGYEVALQDLREGGIIMNPYVCPAVILIHLVDSQIERALAVVRMFHACHPSAHIIAVTNGQASDRVFREAGAKVHLLEPVNHALVFRMVKLLSRRTEPKRSEHAPPQRIRHKTPTRGKEMPLARPVEQARVKFP